MTLKRQELIELLERLAGGGKPELQRRKFLKTAGASLAGVVGAGILGCDSGSTGNGSAVMLNPTRAELIERLQKLAESKPPKILNPGAMCYKMAPQIYTEMPCPDCGRTMRVGEKDEILNAYDVPLKRIQDQGVDAKLILPEHCPHCGFGLEYCSLNWEQITELTSSGDWKPRPFQLEIKYPDDPDPVRVELESALDLEIMALFLQGKDRYTTMQESETALKDYVDRLKELFGVADVK